MNFRNTIAVRRATFGLVALGLAISASTQFTTMAAHASTASNIGTVTAGGTCDATNHTLIMSGTIVLNANRFPNGADVWTEYAYARVGYAADGTVQRTSPYYYTDPVWFKSHATSTFSFIDSSGYTITGDNSASALQAVITTPEGLGREFRVWAIVAVRNGSSWEYSNWDQGTSYDLTGTRYGLTSTGLSTCQTYFT